MKQNGRNHKTAPPPLLQTAGGIDPRSIPIGDLCIVSGILTDTNGTPWINAPWQVDIISPSSPPVYTNGQAAFTMFGNLDATGAFNAYVPRTDFLQPAGCKLRFTIKSVTSAPPLVLPLMTVTVATLNLGAELSPVPAPRIHAGPMVYAYTDQEITNPVNGSGYTNTSENLTFVWQGVQWIPVNSGPSDQVYPPAGVAVSTGSAWAASIPPANIPLLNAPVNNFIGDMTLNSVHLNGGPGSVLPAVANSAWMDCYAGNARLVTVGPGIGEFTGFSVIGIDSAGGDFTPFLNVGTAGINGYVAININNPTTSSGLLATASLMMPAMGVGGNNSIYIGQANSPANCATFGFTFQGNASPLNRGTIGLAGAAVASFDPAGDWNFAGTITAAGKSFRIPHPTRDGMDLIHGCPEGPEWAVYYRGEAATIDGEIEIELPDYFEALTRLQGRTVQLTGIANDVADPGTLTASRIKDGKFTVYSSQYDQEFWWQVTAVRSDIEPLEVSQVKRDAARGGKTATRKV